MFFRSELVDDEMIQNDEIIAEDGDYEDLLPYVNLSRNFSRSVSKKKTPNSSLSSRVCSGSSDPQVLREQLLIAIFDRVWLQVTEIISPLLNQYAKYIIEHSAQLSSFSREPSTRGSRSPNDKPASDVVRNATDNTLLTTDNLARPYSSFGGHGFSKSARPAGRLSRPLSAINRLPPTENPPNNVAVQQLHDLLQITTKPLQTNEDRIRSSTLSALKRRRYSVQSTSTSSIVSLPAVNLGSSGNSLLNTPRTPPATTSLTSFSNQLQISSGSDQRPSSTSSYTRRK